jgi:membrane protease YdiL (CAAX protease family)
VPVATAPSEWIGARVAAIVIALSLLTRFALPGLIGGTGAAIAFYAVSLWIVRRPLGKLRPRWSASDRRLPILSTASGAAAGAGLSIVAVVSGGSSALGPGARAFITQGSLTRTLLALVLTAVVAPVVEELVFRGVVAEALRSRGDRVAVGVSAVLFAIAHLGNLPYHAISGVALGALFRRRGLAASIGAHVGFNATVFTAIVLVARHG